MSSMFTRLAYENQEIVEEELGKDPYNFSSICLADILLHSKLQKNCEEQAKILAVEAAKLDNFNSASIDWKLAFEEYLVMSNKPAKMAFDIDFSLHSVDLSLMIGC